MSVPDYYRNVSPMLSRVMDDIGVNEECVMRLRRTNLLSENLYTLTLHLHRLHRMCAHVFGSQTKGSTTEGLKSDTDLLMGHDDSHVIQDWKDWRPGIPNYMMIQDETTLPGYCKLQKLRSDMPLPYDRLPDQNHVHDEKLRIVLKNGFVGSCLRSLDLESHSPAFQVPESINRGYNNDFVYGVYSPTWPKHYKQWPLRREARDWPTPDMVEYMKTSGCFAVPVAHDYAERKDTELRISTSLAERCLMFSLNITQIRCYVILKMVTKTFIEPFVPKVISSYICKTLLFQTLERTSRDFWREQNLLVCVTGVLLSMYLAVDNMVCPNYFNESANLLLCKLDKEGTRERLLVIIRKLLQSQGKFLLQIVFDDINSRLKTYFLNTHLTIRYEQNERTRLLSCQSFTYHFNILISSIMVSILPYIDIDSKQTSDMLKTAIAYSKQGHLQYRAVSVLLPFLCSYIATVDTSERIRRGQNVSPRALLMYKLSLDSDAASSKLKFASFLYCSGQFESALSVLRQVEQQKGSAAIQLCGCDAIGLKIGYIRQFAMQERKDAFPSTSNVGLCVKYSRSESQCCPLEMRFEYFRSTDEDRLRRYEFFDAWMDLAALDCLPFLFYLQYMSARHLGQRDLQYRALHKLIKSAFGEAYLGHRETAYNVLGQCMEHENRFDKALLCYMMSFQHRPRNNAVRWLFARLWYTANQRRQ